MVLNWIVDGHKGKAMEDVTGLDRMAVLSLVFMSGPWCPPE